MTTSLLMPSVPAIRRLSLASLLALTTSCLALAQTAPAPPPQGKELTPQKTDSGVLFKCVFPGASAIYLAGDFNSWGNNTNGVISDTSAKMTGPDDKGLCQMTVKLAPGDHSLKFCADGATDRWFAPDWAVDHDTDGNAVIHVTDDGVPLLKSQVNAAWAPTQKSGKVTFRLYLPPAQSVAIAGDFNAWANNKDGTVTDTSFQMKKDDDGVWSIEVAVPTGHHVYQFVVDGNKWQLDPNGAGKDDQNHSTIEAQ
jgi:1,4-alpha-glucan branching enzyme